ncbi:MAG TPA: RNA polymerase sporulation sigma factor SigH [Actinomycetota bacterium]|nr:RNA polymerase sporulation sigma factor SigH [Actinomycetota bacterium]
MDVMQAQEIERLDGPTDEDLVALYHAGNAAAAEMLVDRYRDFTRMKVRSYFVAGGDREDVIQEGMIGLYKAIRDYDQTRERSFRTFADVCITRQVFSAVKAARRFKHGPLNTYVSLSSPHPGDESGDPPALRAAVATAPDPSDLVVSGEEIQAIRMAFSELLSDFEAETLHLYVEGKSYVEIAERMGRTPKAIDNAIQRIRRKIDLHLQAREDDTRSVA